MGLTRTYKLQSWRQRGTFSAPWPLSSTADYSSVGHCFITGPATLLKTCFSKGTFWSVLKSWNLCLPMQGDKLKNKKSVRKVTVFKDLLSYSYHCHKGQKCSLRFYKAPTQGCVYFEEGRGCHKDCRSWSPWHFIYIVSTHSPICPQGMFCFLKLLFLLKTWCELLWIDTLFSKILF